MCKELLTGIGMPVHNGEFLSVILTHGNRAASVLEFATASEENEELLRKECFV